MTVPPNVTVVAPETKPVPVRVTEVPPVVWPVLGATLVIVGAAGGAPEVMVTVASAETGTPVLPAPTTAMLEVPVGAVDGIFIVLSPEPPDQVGGLGVKVVPVGAPVTVN